MNGTPNPTIKVQFNLILIPPVPLARSLSASQPADDKISSITPTVATAAVPRLRTFALQDRLWWLTENCLIRLLRALNTPSILNRAIKRIVKHTYPQLRDEVRELSVLIVLPRTRLAAKIFAKSERFSGTAGSVTSDSSNPRFRRLASLS